MYAPSAPTIFAAPSATVLSMASGVRIVGQAGKEFSE
jgi:hypothetical protein